MKTIRHYFWFLYYRMLIWLRHHDKRRWAEKIDRRVNPEDWYGN